MHRRVALLAATIGAAAAIAGCGGSSDNNNPTTLSLKIGENGKTAAFQAPKTAKGGLVKVELANQGKAPHGVQFVQYTREPHRAGGAADGWQQQQQDPELDPGPQGGTGSVDPRRPEHQRHAEPAGRQLRDRRQRLRWRAHTSIRAACDGRDEVEPRRLPRRPAEHAGDGGGRKPGNDKYKWEISGLKTGTNHVTFDSKGKNTVHLIFAVPINGQAPP